VTLGSGLVALAALGIGVPVEVARLRRLSEGYRIKAARIAVHERKARSDATRSYEAWAAKVREMDRQEREGGGWYKIGRPFSPERCGRLIPHFEALRQKYERASRYPWMPVEHDPPTPL